jgi:hypothetical protein
MWSQVGCAAHVGDVAGLYAVQCRKLKEQLTTSSEAVVHQLLDIVSTAARDSNLRVAEDYAVSGNHIC